MTLIEKESTSRNAATGRQKRMKTVSPVRIQQNLIDSKTVARNVEMQLKLQKKYVELPTGSKSYRAPPPTNKEELSRLIDGLFTASTAYAESKDRTKTRKFKRPTSMMATRNRKRLMEQVI